MCFVTVRVYNNVGTRLNSSLYLVSRELKPRKGGGLHRPVHHDPKANLPVMLMLNLLVQHVLWLSSVRVLTGWKHVSTGTIGDQLLLVHTRGHIWKQVVGRQN